MVLTPSVKWSLLGKLTALNHEISLIAYLPLLAVSSNQATLKRIPMPFEKLHCFPYEMRLVLRCWLRPGPKTLSRLVDRVTLRVRVIYHIDARYISLART
jgi:hypothetical protein